MLSLADVFHLLIMSISVSVSSLPEGVSMDSMVMVFISHSSGASGAGASGSSGSSGSSDSSHSTTVSILIRMSVIVPVNL